MKNLTTKLFGLVALLTIVMCCRTTLADEITLSSGKVIVGKIRKQQDGVLEIMREDGSILHVNVLKIERIRKGPVVIKKKPKPDADVTGSQPSSAQDLYGEKIKALELEIANMKRAGIGQANSSVDENSVKWETMEAELRTIKGDMAAGAQTLERLDALQRRVDEETEKNWESFKELKNDLTNNSSELLKVIVSMTELQDRVDSFEPNAAVQGLDLGKDELVSLKKAMDALRADVETNRQVVEDVKSLKISNADLNRRLQELADGRVSDLESGNQETQARLLSLEKQNEILMQRLQQTKGANLDEIYADISALQMQLSEFDPSWQATNNPPPVTQNRSTDVGLDPAKLYQPVQQSNDYFPWNATTMAGSEAETLTQRLAIGSASQFDKWIKVAKDSFLMGDEAFARADKQQSDKHGDIDTTILNFKQARSLYLLALAEYGLVFDNNYNIKCISKMQDLEQKLSECDLRIAYLSRIR